MKASHTLNRLCPAFDDPNLVANAGLILPVTLAHRLGLPELLRTIDLGPVPGRPNPDTKAMTVISALLAGAEYIDDVDVLRSGASHAVVGHRVAAPSTVGTFLRGFRWGHVRQLDAVSRELLRRPWTRGADTGDACLTLDVDSTICETDGLHKQGGSRFTDTHVRGDVVHSRLRGGNAKSRPAGMTIGRQRRERRTIVGWRPWTLMMTPFGATSCDGMLTIRSVMNAATR